MYRKRLDRFRAKQHQDGVLGITSHTESRLEPHHSISQHTSNLAHDSSMQSFIHWYLVPNPLRSSKGDAATCRPAVLPNGQLIYSQYPMHMQLNRKVVHQHPSSSLVSDGGALGNVFVALAFLGLKTYVSKGREEEVAGDEG